MAGGSGEQGVAAEAVVFHDRAQAPERLHLDLAHGSSVQSDSPQLAARGSQGNQ